VSCGKSAQQEGCPFQDYSFFPFVNLEIHVERPNHAKSCQMRCCVANGANREVARGEMNSNCGSSTNIRDTTSCCNRFFDTHRQIYSSFVCNGKRA